MKLCLKKEEIDWLWTHDKDGEETEHGHCQTETGGPHLGPEGLLVCVSSVSGGAVEAAKAAAAVAAVKAVKEEAAAKAAAAAAAAAKAKAVKEEEEEAAAEALNLNLNLEKAVLVAVPTHPPRAPKPVPALEVPTERRD